MKTDALNRIAAALESIAQSVAKLANPLMQVGDERSVEQIQDDLAPLYYGNRPVSKMSIDELTEVFQGLGMKVVRTDFQKPGAVSYLSKQQMDQIRHVIIGDHPMNVTSFSPDGLVVRDNDPVTADRNVVAGDHPSETHRKPSW